MRKKRKQTPCGPSSDPSPTLSDRRATAEKGSRWEVAAAEVDVAETRET